MISGYLAWTAFNATEVYGCGGGSVFDCGHVLNSRYAKIFGLPVSVPAVGMYASLLVVLAFFRPSTPDGILRMGWGLLTIGAISAGLAGLYFTSIQVFELEHLCQYCLGAHACGLTLAGIVIWKRPLGWMKLSQMAGVSVAGLAVLITGQLTAEPPQTFMVERFDEPVEVAYAESTSIVPPGAAEEFGAPMTFDAPLEFAPPTAGDADLFEAPAAPELDSPVVVDNLFAPPLESVESTEAPSSSSSAVGVEIEAAEEEADVTTTISEESEELATSLAAPPTAALESAELPIAATESAASAFKQKIAGAAYLYFSASGSTNAVATRMFAAFANVDAVAVAEEAPEPASTGTNDAGQNVTTQTTAKPVVAAPIKKERLVTVAGSRFSLNTRHWPLLGDPDAKYVFVEMFDYTCPHCRNTHNAIKGAFSQFGDQLAVIALPVPLERSCNPAAKGNGHPGACEQARLAVAVWRCDRKMFRTFHHWMFESTRTTQQARQKAEELVGREKLVAELALGHAGQYISKHVELYKRVGSGAVPKLMFPKSTMTGQVSSSTTLVSTIRRELAAK